MVKIYIKHDIYIYIIPIFLIQLHDIYIYIISIFLIQLPKKVEEIQNVLACVEDHSLDK